jgi:hypothetical protein
MPVELEGYIRPACTILTIFIAMPQHMWDKVWMPLIIQLTIFQASLLDDVRNGFAIRPFTIYQL